MRAADADPLQLTTGRLEHDVVKDRKVLQQMDLLKDEAHVGEPNAGERRFGQSLQVHTVEEHSPRSMFRFTALSTGSSLFFPRT